jgi:hypothetical protein
VCIHLTNDIDSIGYAFFLAEELKPHEDGEFSVYVTPEEYILQLRQYLVDRAENKELSEKEAKQMFKVLQSLKECILIDDDLFVFMFIDLGGMKLLLDVITEGYNRGRYFSSNCAVLIRLCSRGTQETESAAPVEALRVLGTTLNHKVSIFVLNLFLILIVWN